VTCAGTDEKKKTESLNMISQWLIIILANIFFGILLKMHAKSQRNDCRSGVGVAFFV
jgi:hypothetical protein